MDAFGDPAQAARSVIDRVHRSDYGEKNLCCANVAGRFVSANVLLARLQRESIRRSAFSVVGNANESAGHVTFVLIARGKISCVRSAETEWDSEPLRISHCDVGAEFARRS